MMKLKVSKFAAVFVFLFMLAACSIGSDYTRKRVQDLNKDETEALFSLIIKIYKEAFELGEQKSGGYRPAIFSGVIFYVLPDSMKKLEQPIESVSMHSGFVWDSYKEVKKKLAANVNKWEAQFKLPDGKTKKLRILRYEFDYMPGSIGMGSSVTTVTLIPIEVGLSDE